MRAKAAGEGRVCNMGFFLKQFNYGHACGGIATTDLPRAQDGERDDEDLTGDDADFEADLDESDENASDSESRSTNQPSASHEQPQQEEQKQSVTAQLTPQAEPVTQQTHQTEEQQADQVKEPQQPPEQPQTKRQTSDVISVQESPSQPEWTDRQLDTQDTQLDPVEPTSASKPASRPAALEPETPPIPLTWPGFHGAPDQSSCRPTACRCMRSHFQPLLSALGFNGQVLAHFVVARAAWTCPTWTSSGS